MARREKVVIGISAAVAIAGAIVGAAQGAAFTPGDVLVTRSVGGSADLTNNPAGGTVAPHDSQPLAGNGSTSTAVIDEYTPDGKTLVQEVALPNVRQTDSTPGNSYALTFGAGQNNEGTITPSPDGRWFTIIGYNQTAIAPSGGTVSNSADSLTVQRVVGVIGINGSINTTTGLQDLSSKISPRSAFTTDGTNIWAGGSNGSGVIINGISVATNGVHYTTIGSTTSTPLTGAQGNQRIISAYDFGAGLQLLLSSNSSTAQSGGSGFRGLATVGAGLPTTTQTPILQPVQFAGFEVTTQPAQTETADNYWFKDPNTVYVADQRDNTKTGGTFGGVQKWTFTGDANADGIPDTWQFAYSVTLSPTGSTAGEWGAHGLSGKIDPITGQVDLFATNFDNNGVNATSLFEVVDNGSNLTVSNGGIGLVTSATNSAFLGVSVVPYLKGDVNLDNVVNITDLQTVLNNFGKVSTLRADGNMDGSATVDLTDLAQVLNNFGQFIGPPPVGPSLVTAAVPEPASLALFGFGVAGVLMRRRRA